VKYHYVDRFFTYSVRRGPGASRARIFESSGGAWPPPGPAPRTVSGGEFDWGGTSVK
jgi:hypothetical protein